MQLDLIYSRTLMRNQILTARETRTLAAVHGQMIVVAERWRDRGMSSTEIAASINHWHDLLMKRTIELVQNEMQEEGLGAPPCPFCWLLLGSSGRQEQTLQPDQDNALVYEGTPGQEPLEREYFQTFAQRVVRCLQEVGYPYCSGFVMATNERWNLSFGEWQELVTSYLEFPDWDNARYLMMAADMRPVFGDADLGMRLSRWLLQALHGRKFLYWEVSDHLHDRKVSLDFFDRFRVDLSGEHTGEMNIKEGGYLQLISATRLWSLAHGIQATNTGTRIEELRNIGAWQDDFTKQVLDAYYVLLHHRLWSNYVRPDRLPEGERDRLRLALKAVKRLQKLTFKRFPKP